jgi:hypothetical protein
MEPELQQSIHKLLTSYGYEESQVRNWNQSRGREATYYRYSEADRAKRHTVQEVYVCNDGSWEHYLWSADEDRSAVRGGSGRALDSLKAYLQKEHGDR